MSMVESKLYVRKLSAADLDLTTVGGVLYNLLFHPYLLLCRRWNWKSALMSSVVRGLIFFFANVSVGFQAAAGAMLTEILFRALTAGVFGAMTQSFRRARPAWAAALAAVVLLGVANHLPELLIHWASGTPRLLDSILASLAFTVISTLFNLYAMRKGAIIVGPRGRTLGEDLRRMPGIVVGFVTLVPRMLRKGSRG